MDAWVEIVATRLGPPIITNSDEVRFNCFRSDCGTHEDSGYHLYLNPTKGKYFCQRCQRGGSLDSLAKILALPKPEKSLTMWSKIINGFLFGNPAEEIPSEERAQLPLDYNQVVSGTQAYKYLLGRGVTWQKILRYELGFGSKILSELSKESQRLYAGKNRIIFPDFDRRGNVVYWVARTYGNHKAKYKNAHVSRDDKIYNLGRIQMMGFTDRVVICEGPLSAIMAGYDSVATYGKYITGAQIQKLVNAKFGEYIVAIDGDAVSSAVSLATRLWKRGCNVRMVKFNKDEDPASVAQIGGFSAIRKRILNSIKWNENSFMEVMI